MVKNCKTCVNNVEYPPPHTCDECDSLANEPYEMWSPKYSCNTCKYDELTKDLDWGDDLPTVCVDCYDEAEDREWLNWTPKEEDKDEFYLKLICNVDGKEVEISRIRLTELVDKVTTDMVDSFCKAIKMK